MEIACADKSDRYLYFHLNDPPKIFRRINENKKVKADENYLRYLQRKLEASDYTNHYHIEYIRTKNGKTINYRENFFAEHKKVLTKYIKNEEEIDFEYLDKESDFHNYIRIDSYFSIKPEFLNFYLFNLIMKIKIRFRSDEEEQDFFKELKIDNLMSENLLKRLDHNDQIITNTYIKEKCEEFYKVFYNLHFNLQYAILSLITTNRINIFDFDLRFIFELKKLSCDEQEDAASIIENKMIKKTSDRIDILEVFKYEYSKSIENLLLQEDAKDRLSQDKMKIRTIEVSPTRIIYNPPQKEKISHILRKYSEYKENFIKVNFVEEDGGKMFFSTHSMWVIINFIKNAMYEGILVGSRLFEFLSASNSQMKNCSYWFFNLEGTRFLEIEQIMKEQGDFSKETNVHKNAARRGQCLSTTSFIVTLKPEQIIKIKDLERNGYVFTDGIGMISTDLALKCSQKLLKKQAYLSAFQIRMGGIKGMVAVNPDLDGEVVYVRPSMIKYDSNETDLGIIRASNFSQGYLNRQIIILLATLGIPYKIFYSMAIDEKDKIDQLIIDPHQLFQKNNNLRGDLMKTCHYFQPVLPFFNTLKLDIKKEPFLSSLVLNRCISKIIDIKKKGKIFDPYSATLIGVIDETNSLEEGEIFIQIKKEVPDEIFVLDKNCIVTKNPCLHPGDIKLMKATNRYYEKLKHMVNVIVFSAKGKRPVQNEIGGGDLDGDSFFVSWNENLINNMKMKNVPSLPETKNSVHKKMTEISRKNIIDSYIEYMKNDMIALISNAHLAFSDADLENIAYNKKSIKLAEMFCIAIDAPKHGNFIKLEDFRINGLELNEYPDFLENPAYKKYESPGVIGEIYRLINQDEYIEKFDKNEYYFNYLEEYLIELNFVSDKAVKYTTKAYDIYQQYVKDVKELMISAKSLTETELFLSENLYEKKINKNYKLNDPRQKLDQLKEKYLVTIYNTFLTNGKKEIDFDIASAFYMVTYLNDKSLIEYKSLLLPKFNDLVNLLSHNGRLRKRESKVSYEVYKYQLDMDLDYKKYRDIIREKRIFSFPWLLRDVWVKLVRK